MMSEMVEFIVRYNYGKGTDLGIAVPGFDGKKWSHSDKFWFDLTDKEVKDLLEKLMVYTKGDKI